MAPRPAPAKNVPPARNSPQRDDGPVRGPQTRGVKRKAKKQGRKKRALKLKGWLKTPADWAKFDAWAKINAQPRKIPEPEPIVRASKPLRLMKKRIEFLSKPIKKKDNACRTDLGVSKKALTAKPSKRVIILARFVVKFVDHGREFPIKISRAALRYKASKRITEISQPHEMYISEHCKSLNDITKNVTRRKNISRKMILALTQKAIQCPELLTEKELNILVTPTGIYRSALTYKFTPWMKYLSLPSYRFLKDRNDDDANEWKKYILEENDSRGKKALEEKAKKEEKKQRAEEEKKKKIEEEENEKTDEAEDKPIAESENEENKEGQEVTETQDEKLAEKTEKDEAASERKAAGDGKDAENKTEESSDDTKKDDKEDEEAAKRKAARNAWRFTPPACRKNPFAIKRSALNGKVSPRMAELAVPCIRADRSSKKNPFAVRKSALKGPIPPGVDRLAKPNHPLDPIERPPPREKDSFGRPIYPMPPYGKKMPRVKPYKEAECPEKEDKKDDNEEKKKEEKKHRAIDPIVYEPTIDPCIDPDRSKRQIKARIAAKEEFKRIKEAKENEKEKGDGKEKEKEKNPVKTETKTNLTK